MEQKQKEETLKKYLQGLYLTDRETGALNALSELARWFVKERREDRFVRLLKSEFAKARPSQSKTLIRTLYLIDKLVKQYKSFRLPAALVITQIFVELFSIFFQTDSIREMQQMKKLRKRWVTLFPDQVLIKIKRQIQNQFNYNLDSGFSDKITQQLKEYYTKDLKLTPQQISKYLPQDVSQKQPIEKSRSPESPRSFDEPTKKYEPNNKRQPEMYGDHLAPPTKQMMQPMLPPIVPGQPQQLPMGYGMLPQAQDPYQRYGYPDQGQIGHVRYPPPMYPQGAPYQMAHPLGKQPSAASYMVYPPQMHGYPPAYYMPSYPPMDPYYQKQQLQQQQTHQQQPHQHQQQYPQYGGYGMKYDNGGSGMRAEQMRKETVLSNHNPVASSSSTPGSTLSSVGFKSKSNSEGVLEKLKELRLGSFRCPRCGMQSSNRDSFDLHLKSHFQQTKRSYEISKKNNPANRPHLLSLQAWLSLTTQSNQEEYIIQMSRSTDPTCKLCSNSFKPVWDPSMEKWVYRNVVNVQMDLKSLVTLHFSCYKALKDEENPQQTDAHNG